MTLTPGQAWKTLTNGNDRFAAGDASHPHQDAARRHTLADGQEPTAAIFCCGDSRVAAELVFDVGLGDAFVVRNAGQVASDSAIASLEYAVGILNVPVVVVLGHESCGAVRAAIDSLGSEPEPLPPLIAQLISPIVPSVRSVAGAKGDQPIDPSAVDALAVGREHVRATIAQILERSEIISSAVAADSVAIVGAEYMLGDGRVVQDLVIGSV